MTTPDDDRTNFVPPHDGPTTLPASPFFNRLVRFANAVPPRICIRDANPDTPVDYPHIQLLTDVLAFRERAWTALSPETQAALDRRDEVYIAVLAAGGYEYAVCMLAALALGAAAVPITVQLPAKEALYFVTKSRSVCLLHSAAAEPLAHSITDLLKRGDPSTTFKTISAQPFLNSAPLRPSAIKISSNPYLSDNAPGIVIFTSGTTARPKGAVMRRGFIHDTALAVADHYNLTPSDTLLHVLPVHHATGIGINFFPALFSGCVLEFRTIGGFSAEWIWERWRRGGVTVFSGVPTIYMRMMRYYEQVLASRGNVQEYVRGARALKACLCGTSALPKPIADFWAGVLGKKILLRYGATEIGAVFKVRVGDEGVPDGSVGTMFAGTDARLLGEDGRYGDEGEVVVRSPAGELFSKYLFDVEATRKAHTAEGYYRTGDIARREVVGGEEYYWILGRASIDIIKSGGYKLSALDIEREILGLPYVAEVMVVGVPDLEFGERVGAAVVLKEAKDQRPQPARDQTFEPVTELQIDRLRADLRARLAGYKMPTILRVMREELAKSGTGKVVKKILGPEFFPKGYEQLQEIQVWHPTPKAKL